MPLSLPLLSSLVLLFIFSWSSVVVVTASVIN
jgi:hypothetical protein